MVRATDLKNGASFIYQGKPYQVIKYELVKMGRNGALVRVKVRNIESGSVEEKSFSSNLTFEEVNTYKKKLQFLYKDNSVATFMDSATFEQIEIPLAEINSQLVFLKEGAIVDILFLDEKALTLELPPKVTLKVAQTDPGVKGNSATNIYKSAVLENGIKLKVPLFINEGDNILVDSETGEYLERAK